MSDNPTALANAQANATPPTRFIRFTTEGDLLTKSMSLEGGKLKKVACAQPRAATADLCEVRDLEEFAAVLDGLRPTQALVYGVMIGRASAPVVTDARRGRFPNAIARTRQFFQFAAQPGVMMFDHDGMQEGRSIAPTDLHALLVAAVPPLANVRMLWRPSASNGILGQDGEPLTGSVGQRFYIIADDASLIPHAGEAVTELLWAAGHGWIDVGKAGQKLQRSPVDHSAWQPERLDFAAAPVLKAPLTRVPMPWRIFGQGAERLDLRQIIAQADGAVRRSAARNRSAARQSADAESARVRGLWVQEQAPRMAQTRGITEEEASVVLERASRTQTLLGSFELLAEDGSRTTVAEVLADRDRWHGTRFADPLEPDYRGDHRVAWANLKSGGPPYIFSHAHGGCTYRLARELRTIEVREGERPRIVDECLEVMRGGGEVFELGDSHALVRVERGRILSVSAAWLLDHLQRCARFEEHWTTKSGQPMSKAVDLDEKVAKAILAKGSERRLPSLTAVVTAPTIRQDGSLLDENGHDSASGLLLLRDEPDAAVPIPLHPTREEALASLAELFKPFRLFPFVGPVDRAIHMAALLTACIRGSLPTALGFAFDAPTPGTGKTLLARCVGALAIGTAPPILPPVTSKDDDEVRKRLFAILREGLRVAILDNVRDPMGSPPLDAFLTADTFSDRILGVSSTLTLPNRTLFLVTGNNLRFVGDTCRRILRARLDARQERPFVRSFPFCPLQWTLAHRQSMVACALTIIRAWITAGRPRVAGGSFASFEKWDELVRQPLVWLSQVAKDFPNIDVPELDDPMKGIVESFASDDETGQLSALLCAWYAAIGDKWVTVSELIAPDGPHNVDSDMLAIMFDVAGERGRINAKILGNWLARNIDRPVAGLSLRRGSLRGGRATWRVVALGAGSADENGDGADRPEPPEQRWF